MNERSRTMYEVRRVTLGKSRVLGSFRTLKEARAKSQDLTDEGKSGSYVQYPQDAVDRRNKEVRTCHPGRENSSG